MTRRPPKEDPPPTAFTDAVAGPFNDAFAALRPKVQAPELEPPARPDVRRRPAPPKAVVRMERKGHGGKEVTVVEQLELPPAELAAWLKLLKQTLGCGGTLESGTLVLQGDHRERVRAWLLTHGVKKVSVG